MNDSAIEFRTPQAVLGLMTLAILITMAFAVWLVVYFGRLQSAAINHPHALPAPASTPSGASRLPAGVAARITLGDRTIDKRLASADFALEVGQTLAPDVAPGPFRVEFAVPFWTSGTRQALVGAEIQGGQLMILHAGKPVLAEASGSRRLVMSTMATPLNLAIDMDELVVRFSNDGVRPCSLRLLWQPLNPDPASAPMPLPTAATRE